MEEFPTLQSRLGSPFPTTCPSLGIWLTVAGACCSAPFLPRPSVLTPAQAQASPPGQHGEQGVHTGGPPILLHADLAQGPS